MALPHPLPRTVPTSLRDEPVLRSLSELYCLTAEQIARLHYGDSTNFVSKRLAEFWAGKVLERQALSVPRMHGNKPYVYRLGNPGWRYLAMVGVDRPKGRTHHS